MLANMWQCTDNGVCAYSFRFESGEYNPNEAKCCTATGTLSYAAAMISPRNLFFLLLQKKIF